MLRFYDVINVLGLQLLETNHRTKFLWKLNRANLYGAWTVLAYAFGFIPARKTEWVNELDGEAEWYTTTTS